MDLYVEFYITYFVKLIFYLRDNEKLKPTNLNQSNNTVQQNHLWRLRVSVNLFLAVV